MQADCLPKHNGAITHACTKTPVQPHVLAPNNRCSRRKEFYDSQTSCREELLLPDLPCSRSSSVSLLSLRTCGRRIREEEAQWKHLARQWRHTWSGVMAGRSCACVRRAFAHTSGSARSAALAREARSPRQVHRNKIASCPDPRLCKQLGVQQ